MNLSDLNPQQLEAVNHLDGPTLILAGAGSGKTRVLTERYINLIRTRVAGPQSILSVTFTNKAANEMKTRLRNDGVNFTRPPDPPNYWVSTFHSLGARILRENIDLVFPQKGLNILNQTDASNIIKDIIDKRRIPTVLKPKTILGKISRAKDKCLDPKGLDKTLESSFDVNDAQLVEIYELYQAELEKNAYVDFGDLLNLPTKLFQNEPAILEKYQNLLEYIQVDEYQDTNFAQHKLLMLLGSKSKNVCVVGDPDQTIYTWRGARMENLVEFEKQFGNAKTIVLDQNYRSCQNILDFANSTIAFNSNRVEKGLWTSMGSGDKVLLKHCYNEAAYVANEVENLVENEGYLHKDMCILYRTNRHSAKIEKEFLKRQIPYWTRGIGFYERKEILDTIAYLKILHNPSDNIQIRRILNIAKQGIGKESVKALTNWADSNSKNIFEALENAIGDFSQISISPQAKRGVSKIVGAFNSVWEKWGRNLESKTDFPLALDELLELAGYYKYLDGEEEKNQDRGGTSDRATRRQNVNELIDIAKESGNLESFLEVVTLHSEIDDEEETKDHISLMTIHGAKGLEYPVVFVLGMISGQFPMGYSDTDIEEERRLAYVAFTRAQDKLIIPMPEPENLSIFVAEALNANAYNTEETAYAQIEDWENLG